MAHPDDRACLAGETLAEINLPGSPEGLSERAELHKTEFKHPYLVRWQPPDSDPSEEPIWAVATHLLVTVTPSLQPGEAERILRDLAAPEGEGSATVAVDPLPLERLYLVSRVSPLDFNPENPRFLLARRSEFLEREEAVEEANPDYLYFTLPTPRSVRFVSEAPDAELERLGAKEAHRRGITGSRDVRIAVLDTGVDTWHEALAGNILYEDGRVVGYDFHCDRPDVTDGNGHGTYCAGLIGGHGYGVNQEVSILPVQFLSDSGCGTTANAIKAICFALGHGARVLSNSWGGMWPSPDLERAIFEAHARRALFVAGAGNAERNLDSDKYYPASYELPNMISVGGCLDSDEPADVWGRGEKRVHLAAPGQTVLSTDNDPRHGETWRSGTSVSTAFVAGACALVMARYPRWGHMDVRKRIIQSVKRMSAGGMNPDLACCSAGRLDVLNAVTGDQVNVQLDCPGG